MIEKYYIDTCIWIDLYEDREGYNGEPLGEYAVTFLSSLQKKKAKIVITDILLKELQQFYTDEQIRGMFFLFTPLIEKVVGSQNQFEEARNLALERNLPKGDALHAILSRDYSFFFITRDKDFRKLTDITQTYTPEQLI